MVHSVVRNASKWSAIPESSARESLKYQTTRLHKPESHNQNFHHPQDPIFHIFYQLHFERQDTKWGNVNLPGIIYGPRINLT